MVKVDKNSMLGWVFKAAGNDATRAHIFKRIHVENGKAIATNGHKMHIAVIGEHFPDGEYLGEIVKKELWLELLTDTPDKFPAWENVIPKDAKYLGNWNANVDDRDLTCITWRLYDLLTGGINLSHVADMIGPEWKVFQADELSPVLFNCDEMQAVIMPIRDLVHASRETAESLGEVEDREIEAEIAESERLYAKNKELTAEIKALRAELDAIKTGTVIERVKKPTRGMIALAKMGLATI